MSDEEGGIFGGDMFEEPEGYFYEPPSHNNTSYSFNFIPPPSSPSSSPSSPPLPTPPSRVLPLRLVGEHVLWGHCQSEAGRLVADMISGSHEVVIADEEEKKKNKHLYHEYLAPHLSSGSPLGKEGETRIAVQGKRVLELGGGTALPSLVSILCGAKSVVASDYSDPSLLENISMNVSAVLSAPETSKIAVVGHIWGKDVSPLLEATPQNEKNTQENEDKTEKFDLIILSDLVFNHSEHHSLLKSCRSCLAPGGVVLVVFIHHKPENEKKDTSFLLLAQQSPYSFKCQKMFHTRRPVTFPDDEGFEDVRSTAHVYSLF